MWKVLTLFKFNPAGLPSDRKVFNSKYCANLEILEHTIPLYEPDIGLLFGKEGNGVAGHSPLSASWSAVLPEDSSIPAEDERITFSKLSLYHSNE
jgi:hypothetical protein